MHTDLPALLCLPPSLTNAVAPWLESLPPVPAMALAALAALIVVLSMRFTGRGG